MGVIVVVAVAVVLVGLIEGMEGMEEAKGPEVTEGTRGEWGEWTEDEGGFKALYARRGVVSPNCKHESNCPSPRQPAAEMKTEK